MGRISAIFGLRKAGKTSMINRLIDLARMSGTPRIAMIDCSLRGFHDMRAPDALKAVARLARLASQHGYAHISQALHKTDNDLMTTFEGIWSSPGSTHSPLIILDEVDRITPDSPISSHWEMDFNEFWREFRAVVQEARRRDFNLSVLVSGVSSRSFRVAEIAGVENSALHFIPEEYLSPFATGAADAMLKTLGKRCGLQFSQEGREIIAATAAYLPYWMRMAGSYVHRHVELEGRPIELSDQVVKELCNEFAETEGADIARVALQTLYRVDKPMYAVLQRCATTGNVAAREARPLLRYGLVRQRGPNVEIQSKLIRYALELLESERAASASVLSRERIGVDLEEGEWAEELAAISRRRNILERKARELIRVALKMGLPADRNWVDAVMSALPFKRRTECAGLAPDALMGKLYWIELSSISVVSRLHFCC